MSKLMNASPSWSSCLNVECASILFRNYSLNLTNKSYQAADIFDVHDEKLFSATCKGSTGLAIACIIGCRVNVTLDMILGIKDILML